MTIKNYSKKISGNIKLSEHFKLYEFASKDGSDKILIDDKLLELLAYIRNYFDRPVVITSAYRSPAHNKKIGGSPNSQHLKGTAADIMIQGVELLQVAEAAESFLGNSGGIGYYPISKFTHVDVRGVTSRWYEYKHNQIANRDRFYEAPKKEVDEMTEAKKMTIIVNGSEQQIDGIFADGLNYVSIRQLAQLLGAEISNKGNVPVLTKK